MVFDHFFHFSSLYPATYIELYVLTFAREFMFLSPLLWLKTLVNTPFLGCFPGVSQEHYFSLFLCSKSLRVLLKKFFFLNLLLSCRVFPGCFPGVSRVFPGCFPGVPSHNFLYLSFTLLKIPTTFAKEAPLIQNISKCTFPWCFPGISRVFPGCFSGVPEHFFCTLLLLLKIIPTTFVKEVFILKHASLIQNLSKCSFPGCFPGVSRVIPGKWNSRSSLQ